MRKLNKSQGLTSGIALGLQYGLTKLAPPTAAEKLAILVELYNIKFKGRRLFRRSDIKKLLEEI